MKTVLAFVLGIVFVLCLATAVPRYFPRQPHPNIYTMRADPNDPIYSGMSLNGQYLRAYGNSERTIVFYNLGRNSARIQALEQKMKVLLAPPAAEPNEPIDPNN